MRFRFHVCVWARICAKALVLGGQNIRGYLGNLQFSRLRLKLAGAESWNHAGLAALLITRSSKLLIQAALRYAFMSSL